MLGSGFHTLFAQLTESQWYRPEQLEKIKNFRLRSLIKHAYNNVPYYHNLFKTKNIDPNAIKTVNDLQKIPILTKEDVKNNYDALLAVNAGVFNYAVSRTSGTTGTPLKFYLDQQNREIEYATLWRQRTWANVDLNDRIAEFRGFRNLRFIDWQSGKPLWHFDALSKQLVFNIYGLDKTTLQLYIGKLRKHRPILIDGIPSILELVAKYILEYKIKSITPIAVQTSSETLSTSQRHVIEEAFQCNVYDWYSQSEYVVSAGECPEGNHHITESGIMEFIKGGEPVSEGELGEIIGTSLYNYSMPFLRYRLEDVGRYSREKCNCGRGLSIIDSIEGRLSSLVLTPSGKIVSGVFFKRYWKFEISPYTPNIDYLHVIQNSRNKFTIQIVKNEKYSKKEELVIIKKLKNFLGNDIYIAFKYLTDVPKTRKRTFVETNLQTNII